MYHSKRYRDRYFDQPFAKEMLRKDKWLFRALEWAKQNRTRAELVWSKILMPSCFGNLQKEDTPEFKIKGILPFKCGMCDWVWECMGEK